MRRFNGYTLIELLIALSIGVVVLAGLTNILVGSIRTSATAIRTSEFNQEIRNMMNIIIRDVKRAGYSKNAVNDLGAGKNTNAFITTVPASNSEPLTIWTNISSKALPIVSTDIDTAGSCITFAYDQAGTVGDGVLTLKTDDFRGFRLSNDNAVQSRIAGSTQAPSPSCGVGLWQDMTSPDINVTNFTFQWLDYTNMNDPTSTTIPAQYVRDHAVISQRVIRVTLSANSKSEPTLARTLQADIRVRNNLYNPDGT